MAVTLNPTSTPADAAAIAARINEAEQRLRAALLDGLPTKAVHAPCCRDRLPEWLEVG